MNSTCPALQSVYDQTLALDVIVVEDCSRDGSLETARRCMERMQARFHRTCLVRHTANLGLAAARNTAFRLAATPLVFVLDADNVLYPRCLERLHEALRHNSAALAYSLIERMGDETGLMGTLAWDPAIFTQDNYIDAMVDASPGRVGSGGRLRGAGASGLEDFDAVHFGGAGPLGRAGAGNPRPLPRRPRLDDADYRPAAGERGRRPRRVAVPPSVAGKGRRRKDEGGGMRDGG